MPAAKTTILALIKSLAVIFALWIALPWGMLFGTNFTSYSVAQAEDIPEEHPVRVELQSLHESLDVSNSDVQATSTLALVFHIEPGWHIYWKNSGESAMPTKVEWTASNGWKIGELQWATPVRFIERGDITTFGYKNEAILLAEMHAEVPQAYADKKVNISARVKWLVCRDVCIPGSQDVSHSIALTEAPAQLSPAATTIRAAEDALPKSSIDAVSLETQVLHPTLAPQSSSEIVFSLSGLSPLEKEAIVPGVVDKAAVQLFPGPHRQITLGPPSFAWSDATETLVVRAAVDVSASAPIEVATLDGVLAFSSAHLPGQNAHEVAALNWEATFPIAAQATEADPAVAKRIDELTPFSPAEYRLSRWDDAPKEEQATQRQSSTTPANQTATPQHGVLVVLLFAFIGGLILNLMPCVLPIIAIKVMGFVEQKKHGDNAAAIWFCAGVLFSFVVLASVVIGLRSIGVQLGWGFQFQHPEFVATIALVVFVLSLGFFDLYVFALPFMQRYCSAVDTLKPSATKHFFDGIIATILSTPCTAPFLGTALVFAFTQGPLYTLGIHLAIGFGLATPYFLLATNPKFLSILPKPGTWMHRMRQFMGFLLLATVLWLLFVLQKLTGEGVIWCLLMMLIFVFCIWFYDWSKEWSVVRRNLWRAVIAIAFLLSVITLYPKATLRQTAASTQGTKVKNGVEWTAYSAEGVEAALASDKPVFIDFTADWCITCKANEALIINTDPVSDAIRRYEVVPMIADWTNGDERITTALQSFGGRGVPLYVVLTPGKEDTPVVLNTIPSKSALIEAFRQAAQE